MTHRRAVALRVLGAGVPRRVTVDVAEIPRSIRIDQPADESAVDELGVLAVHASSAPHRSSRDLPLDRRTLASVRTSVAWLGRVGTGCAARPGLRSPPRHRTLSSSARRRARCSRATAPRWSVTKIELLDPSFGLTLIVGVEPAGVEPASDLAVQQRRLPALRGHVPPPPGRRLSRPESARLSGCPPRRCCYAATRTSAFAKASSSSRNAMYSDVGTIDVVRI
jgi:hypothetical protein